LSWLGAIRGAGVERCAEETAERERPLIIGQGSATPLDVMSPFVVD
jgi:hypothetical protein